MLTQRFKKAKYFLNWINNPVLILFIFFILLANLLIAGFILFKLSNVDEGLMINSSKLESIEAQQADLQQKNEYLQSSLMRMESMLYRLNSGTQN